MKNSCWPQLFETFPICTTSKCLTTGRVHRCQVSPDTDLLHCPSCKFMAPAVASPNSLRLDLRALFYVADDSERRRRRQIILWRKKKRKNERDGERVWERGDRRLPRLNLGPGVSDTHPRSRRGRARTELHTPTAKREQHSTRNWLIRLLPECKLFISTRRMCGSVSFVFPSFLLGAGHMTHHHLPVLLHLQAHICQAGIKQNGSAIKWLWQLSSHTS